MVTIFRFYAPGLELTYLGLDPPVPTNFRRRLVASHQSQVLFDAPLRKSSALIALGRIGGNSSRFRSRERAGAS
jgi:hypothetical protein